MSKIISVILAVVFSFFVFVGMTVLIKPKAGEAIPEVPNKAVSFTFKDIDTPPELNKRVLPKHEIEPKPKKATTRVTPSDTPNPKPSFERVVFNTGTGIELSSIVGTSTGWGGGGDGEATPRVRINPSYPDKAARDNIEGYVTLTFDISEMGRPINVAVVDAKPRGVFEKSARRALKKWKYDPKKLDDKAVSQLGQSVTLVFQLESELL